MSNGCDTRDILAALGLTYSDLFFDKMTPQVRARTSLQEQRANLERELGLVIWLGVLGKPRYWEAAERRIRRELLSLRCRIEPERMYREWRDWRWQRMTRKQKEAAMEAAYGVYCATKGAGAGAESFR